MTELLKRIKRKILKIKNQYRDKHTLKKAFDSEFPRKGIKQTELNILLLSHSLEKGMGIDNPKIGFGQEKAKKLLDAIAAFTLCVKVPKSSYVYNEGMSVLGQYIKFTMDSGCEVTELEKNYRELLNCYGCDVQNAGYEYVDVAALYDRVDLNASLRFLASRRSIRSYEKRPVEGDVVEKVLAAAASAPSACNRQPVKVYWTNTDTEVEKISKLIPGNKGFEDKIPNWAIVAVDRNMFGEQECLQWYLNGGIYAAHLVLSFHAFHIGACIFQMPIVWKYIQEIKEIAGIPKHYAIACIIGFGYPKEKVKCLCATRKSASEYGIRF